MPASTPGLARLQPWMVSWVLVTRDGHATASGCRSDDVNRATPRSDNVAAVGMLS
jgi:hypothetical protein